jgi:predicted N-acetyltransferase YhbS
MMDIRNTAGRDEPAIREVHESAFGAQEGPVVAELTIELLHDPTAKPLLSLLAVAESKPVGHVLFTSVRLSGAQTSPVAHILAPLGVVPDHQRQGVGTQLVRTGLAALERSGCELVFVLGHPEYYPAIGFQPAGPFGFSAPYPIAERNAAAWMVLELQPGILGAVHGAVRCAEAMNKPEYWVE